jgi:hypothetical protein
VIRSTATRRGWAAPAVLAAALAQACVEEDDGGREYAVAGRVRAGPDTTLRLVEVEPGPVTPAGAVYLAALHAAHEDADRLLQQGARAAAIARMREALARPRPQPLIAADLARLELAARLCETVRGDASAPALAARAGVALLQPMLAPSATLPADPVVARALVELGDAASQAGDAALAAGSYARAIAVMSALRARLEADLELDGARPASDGAAGGAP